jgi:hypothetical protein
MTRETVVSLSEGSDGDTMIFKSPGDWKNAGR